MVPRGAGEFVGELTRSVDVGTVVGVAGEQLVRTLAG
jgi:hypothetical protein